MGRRDELASTLRLVESSGPASPGQPRTDVADLYRDALPELLSFLTRTLGNRRDAEDVAQDAFERLCRVADTDEVANARGLLFTTAHRLALNHLRNRRTARDRQASQPRETMDAAADPSTIVDDRERLDRAWDAIARLPEKTCHVFLLHRFEGLTYREIADQVGLSRKSVEYHMGRALRGISRALHTSTGGYE